MRHLIVGSLSGALLLVAGATDGFGGTGTSGTTVQSSDVEFTSTATKRSAGVRISISSTDQQNPQNRQPKRIASFAVTFPQGTRIDSRAAPQCRATDLDFTQADNPDEACPRGSKIATGRAAMRLPFPGTADFLGTVSAYNANKGLTLFIDFPTAGQSLVLRPKFRGLRLRTSVPQTCVPPAQPQSDCAGNFGARQEAILVALNLNTRPKSARSATGRRRLIRTPKACPSSGWGFRTSFKYADGSALTIPSSSHCRRP